MPRPNVSKVVVDSSAVLAYLQRESGWEDIEPYLAGETVISAVNLAEILSKLHEQEVPADAIRQLLAHLALNVVAFDDALAYRVSELRVPTRSLGLSLGDRACLGLAQQLGLPVITVDQIWSQVALPIEIKMLRPHSAGP